MNQDEPTFIPVGDKDNHRSIAVLQSKGENGKPGIFWLGGFKSSMAGEKALALDTWGQANNVFVTRFDYSGHGESSGVFEEQTITNWLEEAEAVFTSTTSGPQVLVGSSMGGWLALLLALRVGPERLAGIVLIAPAWDMTERNMWQRFTDDIKEQIKTKGFYARPSAYGDGDYIITKKLIEDGRNHLLGDKLLKIGAPIHILHGKDDPDVPWEHGHALTTLLAQDDVTFTLVPDGDHRLSRPQDIALLIKATGAFFQP